MKEESCFEKTVAFERILCGIGNGWGYIAKTELLFAWWTLRHIIYFAVSALLAIFVPSSLFPLVIFFLAVHSYKLLRYGFYSVYDERKKDAIDDEPRDVKSDVSSVEKSFEEESPC
mmetsp:Transcript_13065/g.15925  ORF Transcript_13065/g.15925 Transcript_13065/m.15925 type:complete len:116 (+) Transcript_13065:513-860(+)